MAHPKPTDDADADARRADHRCVVRPIADGERRGAALLLEHG